MANNIYKLVEQHVSHLFESNKRPNLFYHNLEHTQETLKRAEEIAAHYKLSEKEMLAVYIAAWFHDTGRIFTGPENHEEKGVELMKSFMQINCPEPLGVRMRCSTWVRSSLLVGFSRTSRISACSTECGGRRRREGPRRR